MQTVSKKWSGSWRNSMRWEQMDESIHHHNTPASRRYNFHNREDRQSWQTLTIVRIGANLMGLLKTRVQALGLERIKRPPIKLVKLLEDMLSPRGGRAVLEHCFQFVDARHFQV